MTETEWLSCNDPTPMLRFLQGKASDRKLRLFAVACCRRLPFLLTGPARPLLDTLDRGAEGQLSLQEIDDASDQIEELGEQFDESVGGHDAGLTALWHSFTACKNIAGASWEKGRAAASVATSAAAWTWSNSTDPAWATARVAEEAAQGSILLDLFGNPFRPVALDAAWLTTTAVGLAQSIYDERAFDRLPILADALEDAGCTNADILDHCRQPGEHVRGCWVVDLLLGKV
jgi:hypothetical protein